MQHTRPQKYKNTRIKQNTTKMQQATQQKYNKQHNNTNKYNITYNRIQLELQPKIQQIQNTTSNKIRNTTHTTKCPRIQRIPQYNITPEIQHKNTTRKYHKKYNKNAAENTTKEKRHNITKCNTKYNNTMNDKTQ